MSIGKKNNGALALMLLVSGMLAACGGGSTPSTTSNPPAPTGATLTLTAPFTSLTNQTPWTALDNTGGTTSTTYTRATHSTTNSGFTTLYYTVSSTYTTMFFDGFPVTGNNFSAGTLPMNMICLISGTNAGGWPTCSSWGIAINRSAGTITFTSTPVFDSTSGQTGTMSGSLTFTPF